MLRVFRPAICCFLGPTAISRVFTSEAGRGWSAFSHIALFFGDFIMKRTIALGLGLAVALGMVGCNDTTKVKKSQTVTTPGGSTTTSTETKVESSGSTPPAAPKP